MFIYLEGLGTLLEEEKNTWLFGNFHQIAELLGTPRSKDWVILWNILICCPKNSP